MRTYWVACLNEQRRFAVASPRLNSYEEAESFAQGLDVSRVPVIIVQ